MLNNKESEGPNLDSLSESVFIPGQVNTATVPIKLGQKRGCLRVLAIEARHFAGGFAVDGALFQVGAFIVRDFSLGDTELGFQLAIFPVQIEKDKSASGDLG